MNQAKNQFCVTSVTSEFIMERNLLEREIAALNNAANSLAKLQLTTSADAEVKLYPSGKFSGTLREKSFLRNQDLKTKQTFKGKELYYPNKQLVNILGENADWVLVEGGATYKENGIEYAYLENNIPVNLKGWIKKSWVVYKIPLKLDDEPTNGYTCYVAIDLGLPNYSSNYPEKMTAIYIPDNFRATSETDIIIYLHGHLTSIPGYKLNKTDGKLYSPSIKDYLNYSKDQYFNFRKIINSSGKNVVFVAPTLGPKSQYGNLATNFDGYMEQVIAAINEYIFKEQKLGGQFSLGNLILSAHSGGGSGMLAIAKQSNSSYVKRIKSFWGFDSWYGENTEFTWNKIAKNEFINIYAYEHSSHHLPKPIKDRVEVKYRKEVKGKNNLNHFTLLPYYFNERISSL